MKEKKKLYISLGIIGIVLLLMIVIISSSNKLSDVEQKIYNAVENEKSNFKNPASVKIQSVKICGDYATIMISATNSFGAIVSSKYSLYIGKELEKPDGKIIDDYYWLRDSNLKSSDMANISQIRKNNILKFQLDISKECLDNVLDETIVYEFTDNQLKAINKKLSS